MKMGVSFGLTIDVYRIIDDKSHELAQSLWRSKVGCSKEVHGWGVINAQFPRFFCLAQASIQFRIRWESHQVIFIKTFGSGVVNLKCYLHVGCQNTTKLFLISYELVQFGTSKDGLI